MWDAIKSNLIMLSLETFDFFRTKLLIFFDSPHFDEDIRWFELNNWTAIWPMQILETQTLSILKKYFLSSLKDSGSKQQREQFEWILNNSSLSHEWLTGWVAIESKTYCTILIHSFIYEWLNVRLWRWRITFINLDWRCGTSAEFAEEMASHVLTVRGRSMEVNLVMVT